MTETKPAQQRQTAIKTPIQSIVEGEYVVQEGWEPNFVYYQGERISRANIMGVVVGTSSDMVTYDYLIVDDGTGRITVRSFDNTKQLDFVVGDPVLIIGRPREYGGEIYVMPEIVKKINPRWLEYRKLELPHIPRNKEALPIQKEEKIVEEVINSPEEKVITFIRDKDGGEGVDMQMVITQSKEEQAEMIIRKLLQQGELFETRPGKVKVLK